MRGKRAVQEYILDIDKRGNEAQPKEQQSLPVLQLINEAMARGIRFLPVDLTHSSDREYLPESGGIRMPFSPQTSLPPAKRSRFSLWRICRPVPS